MLSSSFWCCFIYLLTLSSSFWWCPFWCCSASDAVFLFLMLSFSSCPSLSDAVLLLGVMPSCSSWFCILFLLTLPSSFWWCPFWCCASASDIVLLFLILSLLFWWGGHYRHCVATPFYSVFLLQMLRLSFSSRCYPRLLLVMFATFWCVHPLADAVVSAAVFFCLVLPFHS